MSTAPMRSLLHAWLVASWALGCAGTSPHVALPAIEPAPEPDGCADQASLVLELPPLVAVRDGGALTSGQADGVLRWCGPGDFAFGTAILTWPDGASQTWEHAVVLAHGETDTLRLLGRPEPATGTLLIHGTSGGAPVTARGVVRSLPSPVDAAERVACEARGGSYGPHGMLGIPMCDAPTRDAGRACRSSAECEIACIADDAATVLEGGCFRGEERFEHRGRCFDRTLLFGCHTVLREPVSGCRPIGTVTWFPAVSCID